MTSRQPQDREPAGERDLKAGRQIACPTEVLTRRRHWIFAALICILVLLFFSKTCFAGGSISRLCVLAEWDSLFDSWRTGPAQAYDPSLVQIFLPDYVFLAQNLSRGVLPLWNPHCGLGFPFLADIQSSVFAPLRLLFDLRPTLASYNLFLVSELLVCGIACYALAIRLLEIGFVDGPARAADRSAACLCALFAAIAYTFCPYNLWYLELNLGSSAALFPLVTLAFVQAAGARTLGSAILAGIVSAVLILSGHPECSFFGVLFAGLLMILLLLFSGQASPLRRTLSALKLLVVAALSTVAVSAPSLIPFGEYLLNAESYKYGLAFSTPVTWNGILFNLVNPGQAGASPYLGIIAAIALPLSLLGLQKTAGNKGVTLALLVLTGFSFLIVCQLGPLQILFSKAPFSTLITRYALPYLLMLESLLAAFGLLELARLCRRPAGAPEAPLLLLLVVMLLILPAGMLFWSAAMAGNQTWLKLADFDAMLPATAWNASAWRRDIICAGLFFLSSLAAVFLSGCGPAARQQNRRQIEAPVDSAPAPAAAGALLILTIACILGFVSEASQSRLSLPQQAKFFYPRTDVTEKLRNTSFRSLSTCEYLLRPSTNAVYGINFLCNHNPLFPRRFLSFLKACGARTDIFNQKFDSKLSELLNLASVKYVLAFEPVEDTGGRTAERFSLFYESKNKIRIYENRDAAPRAYLVHECRRSCSPAESLRAIQSKDFNSRTTVVLESAEPPQSKGTDARVEGKAGGTARTQYEQVKSIEFPNPNTVRITCQPQASSWLVLTDIYYPGWQARVDGKTRQIERANYVFRAVRVEPGNHEILFAYQPCSFYCGCGIFAAFALLCTFALASGIHRRIL
jgi:hypothetical protein